MSHHSRRQFLSMSLTAGSIVGLGQVGILADFAPASDKETRLAPHDVRLTAELAPLVRKIEETAQEKIIAVMVEELRNGMTYRQFLAAIFLAAARMNVSPHQVYVVHSAHQLSLDLPYQDRLLPLFWAVYALKWGEPAGTRYPPMDLARLPASSQAAAELDDAMRRSDIQRAEVSLLAICRAEGPKAAWGRLWPYVARDPSNIGHRAIAFVQAWRTLETIGWRHAESLVQFVIQELNGNFVPFLYPVNVERSARIDELPLDWAGGRTDADATIELLGLLHAGSGGAACRWTFDALKRGTVQAQSVWDAVFLAAGEIMLRFNTYQQLPARPLHTTTSMNALHYCFHSCTDRSTRLLTLLMAVDWTARFIATELERGKLRDMRITEITDVEVPDKADEAVAEIFSRQPLRYYDEERQTYLSRYEGPREVMDHVSRMAFAFGRKHAHDGLFIATARQLTCRKSTLNAHDLKFPMAVFENYGSISPMWRPHLLATSMQHMHGSRMVDNPAVDQAREALS